MNKQERQLKSQGFYFCIDHWNRKSEFFIYITGKNCATLYTPLVRANGCSTYHYNVIISDRTINEIMLYLGELSKKNKKTGRLKYWWHQASDRNRISKRQRIGKNK